MMSRIEMELRIRQQELRREVEREQAAETAMVKAPQVRRPRIVHSQFYMQRFGRLDGWTNIRPA